MDALEIKALMEDVAAVMKSLVSNAMTPIVFRIDAMEKRFGDLPTPKDGKDADADAVAALAAEKIRGDVQNDFTELRASIMALKVMADEHASLPPPRDGKDVDMAEVRSAIEDAVTVAVAFAVAALPPAEKGKDADPIEVAAIIAGEVERAVAALPRPEDGKSITVDDIRWLIHDEVTKVVTLIPVPKDGRDGRDGLDAVKFLRGDKGNLIVTMSNGTVEDLGEVNGRDGKDADVEAIKLQIAAAIPEAPEVDPAMITRMIDEAVAKHTPEPIGFAPDEVAHGVSLALKTMAGYSSKAIEVREAPIVQPVQPQVNVHMAPVTVGFPEQQAPIVNLAAPVVNVAPPNVNIEARRGKEVTRVTGWDKSGRITTFEKTEVDE